jgi:ABC-type transport system involved in multi-copper enzyme maturation permease subunit
MIFDNAVIHRDLRARMRGWSAGAMTCCYLAALGATALAVLFVQVSSSGYDPAEAGTRVFQAVALAQLILFLIFTPLSFARSITLERARRTWDLLLMTRLGSCAIIWGKLSAGLAFYLWLAFAALPLFAVGFSFRIFPVSQFAKVYAILLATILLSGSIGLLISVLARSVVRSMAYAGTVAAAVSVGLAGLILNAGNAPAITLGPLRLAPDWTRLAPVDPLAALMVALPNGRSVLWLGPLAASQDALGSPIPTWAAFVLLSVGVSAAALVVAARRVRTTPHHWVEFSGEGS